MLSSCQLINARHLVNTRIFQNIAESYDNIRLTRNDIVILNLMTQTDFLGVWRKFGGSSLSKNGERDKTYMYSQLCYPWIDNDMSMAIACADELLTKQVHI